MRSPSASWISSAQSSIAVTVLAFGANAVLRALERRAPLAIRGEEQVAVS